MNIHEFQAKSLLNQYGISTLDSRLARSSKSALKAAQELGGHSWVLKAQVHAGGRGKGGGIKIAKSLDEVKELSRKMIGMNLITPQTGSSGEKVHQILVEKTAEIEKEFYIALLVDRSAAAVSMIVSSQGGVDIEETARTSPEKITRIRIHPLTGLCSFQKRACADVLGLSQETEKDFFKIMDALYSLFIKEDLALLEINPFILTKDEKLCPLDAKISLDSNAGYRHPHWSKYVLEEELKLPSAQAQLKGFSFVPLDGSIGCMVNGAGLAMATMDMIQLFGGEPANFWMSEGMLMQNAFKRLSNLFYKIQKCGVF